MIRLLILFLSVLLCPIAAAESAKTSVVTPYLGLSLPYIDSIPVWTVELKKGAIIRNRSLLAFLAVDEKGDVTNLEFPPDSITYIEPIEKNLKKVKFHFIEGRDLSFPVMVPVIIRYSGSGMMEKTVTLKFPITADSTSDSELLSVLLERNGVEVPQVMDIKPIFYKVDPTREKAECITVTARVFLDETGELINITYPITGQDVMTHQVHMAMMNARFIPATLNGAVFASDFLLTFRIFDNIRYPFSPLSPPDSTRTAPITTHYFMTQYLNGTDISIPPLPRKHGSGIIQAALLARHRIGSAEIILRINAEGKTRGVSVQTATPNLADEAQKVVKLITWYPALNRLGEPEAFVGRVSLRFDASTKVVYIPEWLP
jgi:hypothetical protein